MIEWKQIHSKKQPKTTHIAAAMYNQASGSALTGRVLSSVRALDREALLCGRLTRPRAARVVPLVSEPYWSVRRACCASARAQFLFGRENLTAR